MTAQTPVLREHGNAYNIFMLVLTIFSLVIMVLLFLPVSPSEHAACASPDLDVVCVIFLIDFAINLARREAEAGSRLRRRRGWLDLLGSHPELRFLPVPGALLRLARLSRLARIAKLLSGSNPKALVKDVLDNRGEYAQIHHDPPWESCCRWAAS